MVTSSPDQVSLTHEKEFAGLRRKRRKRIAFWLGLVCLSGLLLVIVPMAILDYQKGTEAVESARAELLLLRSDWGRVISSQQYYYAQWLLRHGTKGEVALFNYVSHWVLRSAIVTISGRFSTGRWPIVTNVYLSLHPGLLRISYVFLVSWRIWLVVLLLAGAHGFLTYQVYNGSDLLGELGNGRFFFSGLQADLSKVDEDGVPISQVTGLACPGAVPQLTVMTHSLGKLLHEYQAANQTTLGLAAIIIKHADYPVYLARQNEEDLLRDSSDIFGLDQHSCDILEKAFQLQSTYQKTFKIDPSFVGAEGEKAENSYFLQDQYQSDRGISEGNQPAVQAVLLPVVAQSDQKVNSASYALFLQQAFDRVLTVDMKREIATLSNTELATAILSLQAGKVLAFGKVSGRWVRKSSFPHLSARAVLHSLPAFSEEFSFEARTLIRRALVYGARKSAFANVRFPIDMSLAAQALRQWIELLMACPYELQAVADDVELFAHISGIHYQWTDRFFDEIAGMKRDILREVFVSPHNLIFVPVKCVLEIARQFVPRQLWPRLHELTRLVSNKQRLFEMAYETDSPDAETPPSGLNKGTVLAPFSKIEIDMLAKMHSLKEEDVQDWGVLRLALNSYAWLGRRVGDYTVPPSSLIFAVFSPELQMPDQNGIGLVGRSGMVAFRTRRLEERFGRGWRTNFIPVHWAKMAENTDDYQKLLSGVEEIIEVDKDGTAGIE